MEILNLGWTHRPARATAAPVALLFAAMISFAAIAADSDAALERRLKAVFVSKFAGYVEWPASVFSDSASPIVIGVAGADPLAEELEQAIAGRLIGERPMQVRRLGPQEPIGNCCQIVFLGRGLDRARASEILATTQGKPVLTVTENERGQQPGSVINFLAADGRIRFDISRGAAERNGLRLSSQLLGVARQVTAASQ
jgi:hypothetical protein